MSGYKKISTNHQKKQPWQCVTNFYAPIWMMWFCVLYHQTIIFTRKKVFISVGQCMLWSQKVCWKCIFLRPGDPNLLTHQTVKKLNLWEKTAIDKSAWIKAWTGTFYIIKGPHLQNSSQLSNNFLKHVHMKRYKERLLLL